MTDCWLLADIGGTNARFALSYSEGQLSQLQSTRTAEHPTFVHALNAYLQKVVDERATSGIRGARVAAAGPREEGTIALTNSPWQISVEEVSEAIGGGGPVRLFNDLEAVVMLLPRLGKDDIEMLGPICGTRMTGNLLAVNMGTGLGASSAIMTRDGEWVVSASEAGHMSFSATSPDEVALLPHVTSLEDVLSGRGVAWLYEFLNRRSGGKGQGLRLSKSEFHAAQIFASVDHDSVAAQVVRLLTELLARVTADLVLANGAWGGAYLCGSVASGWHEVADQHLFRSVFERKGAMSSRMERVPTALIVTPEPTLRGLTYAGR